MIAIHGELTADRERIIVMAVGPDHEVAQAAKYLGALTPLVKATDPAGAVWMPASWPAVVQLAATYGPAWKPGATLQAWIVEQVTARTGHKVTRTYATPDGRTPYPWQLEGAAMFAATGASLFTDQPGTGKTLTAILGLLERDVHPVIVVCPASVVDPWVEEWQRWAPHLRTIAWRGPKARRASLARTADVYVVSYDTARNDAPAGVVGPLMTLGAQGLVIDECHKIKNNQTVQSQAVRRIARHVSDTIALSGTPITHHPGDLWPTLAALDEVAWPSKERWIRRYCLTADGDYGTTVIGLNPKAEPEFRETLLGQHRRVAKADVLAELPAKVYTTRTVELPPAYRKAYDAMERDMLADLPEDGGELSVMGVLAQLTRLSQMACAAADVSTIETPDEATGLVKVETHVRLKAPSWKVDELLDILAEREGEPVVAFAPSRQLMVLAGSAAEAKGLRVGYILGGQTMRDRTETIERFQAGELDLMCATTQAGGVGITLTASRCAVFLQRPWSLVDALQAEDRIHRIGSERHDSVDIIDVVARNTIDTRVRSVLREKAGQLGDLVQDPRIVAELLGGAGVRSLTRKAS